MMDKLKDYILKKRAQGPLYMPYLTAGDPDFASTVRFACGMIDAGADLIELGIPFSDPTADGPVIQAAMVRAMENADFSLERIFQCAREIHEARPDVPIVFLSYMNPVFRGFAHKSDRPLEAFLAEAARAGIQGIVIPDLPADQPEAIEFFRVSERFQIAQIFMSAPNTSPARLSDLRKHGRGFIYHVTSYGVTGERSELPPEVKTQMKAVRESTGLPVFAGFGFSRPEQAEAVKAVADGVIVGSLHHRLIQEKGAGALEAISESTAAFVKALRG